MGFRRSILKLKFEDPEFAELEVRCRRLTVGELLDVAEWVRILSSFRGTKAELKAELKELFVLLDAKIIDWNYEIEHLDGTATLVPKDIDGLSTLDEAMLTAITTGIVAGSKAVTGRAAGPLERPVEPEINPLEASIPMTPL